MRTSILLIVGLMGLAGVAAGDGTACCTNGHVRVSQRYRTPGIIGGMGPAATCDLMMKVIENTVAADDQHNIHLLVDQNTDVPDRTAAILKGGADPLPEMLRSARRLEREGADFLCMSCNTAHYFYDKLAAQVSVPILNMPAESAKELKRRGVKKVGLLATDGTIKTGVYHKFLQAEGVEVVVPEGKNQATVMSLIYDCVKKGVPTADYPAADVKATVEDLRARGAEAFLMACTELPIAFERLGYKEGFVDPTRCLARAIIREAGAPLVPDGDILAELVGIPSVTADIPAVNRAAARMKAYLESKGVPCAVERDADGREVLWASARPGKEQDVVIVCHLDVVPGPESIFTLTKKDGRAYGRGTCDCKGYAVAVANALADLCGKASVGCIFSTDEETGGATTKLMLERGYRPRKGVIVTDIAEYGIVYAHKGYAMLRLVARGRKGLSSKPWTCDNAFERLVKGCAAARAAWDRAYPTATADDLWHDTLSITMGSSVSKVPNAIPDYAEAQASMRCTSPDSVEKAVALIKEASGLEVEVGRTSPLVVSDPNDSFVVSFKETMRRVWDDPALTPKRICGGTDARHFAKLGLPIVLAGSEAGNEHKDEEWCDLAGLERLRKALADFAGQFR